MRESMGLMNERATDQMGCAHPWPVLVDPCACVRVCVCLHEYVRQKELDVKIIFP